MRSVLVGFALLIVGCGNVLADVSCEVDKSNAILVFNGVLFDAPFSVRARGNYIYVNGDEFKLDGGGLGSEGMCGKVSYGPIDSLNINSRNMEYDLLEQGYDPVDVVNEIAGMYASRPDVIEKVSDKDDNGFDLYIVGRMEPVRWELGNRTRNDIVGHLADRAERFVNRCKNVLIDDGIYMYCNGSTMAINASMNNYDKLRVSLLLYFRGGEFLPPEEIDDSSLLNEIRRYMSCGN